MLELGNAKRDGTLARTLGDISRSSLLVLDEFGYMPFNVDGAHLLYQAVFESYERRAIIFTTNI